MRVKSVVYTRQRKKKWFRRAKGAYATKSTRWRMVIQHLEMSMRHMYRGRKDKKRDLRAIWIQRINAAARAEGLSYSRFFSGLKKAGVVIGSQGVGDDGRRRPGVVSKAGGPGPGTRVAKAA
jgi:large subunit ribosomal protein L20